MYTTTKEERRKAFETPMTPDQIAKWGEQQRLPRNVVYKMLEKYYYFDFLHKIEEIVGDDEKIDDTEMKTLLKYLEKKIIIKVNKYDERMGNTSSRNFYSNTSSRCGMVGFWDGCTGQRIILRPLNR